MVRLTFFAFFLLIFSVLSTPLRAEVIPGSSCDVDVYKVLSDRAWMEGQREMEIAQKLILKPDSVLEYSCFSQRRNELRQYGMVWSRTPGITIGSVLETAAVMIGAAAVMQFILGDSTGFDNIISDLGNSVIGAIVSNLGGDPLQLLIDNPLPNYLSENFYHSLGGGAYDGGAVPVCGSMAAIWDFLKCSNFEEDYFISFDELSTNDFRSLPRQCSSAARNQKWLATIVAAAPQATAPAQPGGMDALQLRNDTTLDVVDCSAAPVDTGVMVIEGTATPYPEKVCVAPGCWYSPAGGCERFSSAAATP